MGLLADVATDSKYFDDMVDLIPVHYYYPSTGDVQDVQSGHRTTNEPGDGKKVKAKYERGEKQKNKTKKEKLDPEGYKTVVETQEAEREVAKQENTTPQGVGGAASMEELRAKLQMKLTSLSKKRRPSIDEEEARKTQKLSQKKRKKLKLAAQKQSGVKPDKKTATKTEMKENKKDAKEKKETKKEEEEIVQDLTFSNVKEDNVSNILKSVPKKKSGALQKALKKAQAFNTKIDQLKQDNPEEAEKILQERAVTSAIQKAKGVKLKDDPAKLKKALKKKEKSKQKSQKEWAARTKEVQQGLAGRQEEFKKKVDYRIKNRKEKTTKLLEKRAISKGL